MSARRRLAASVIALMLAHHAAAQEAPAAPPDSAALLPRLTDELIRNAVKETLAAEPQGKHGRLDGRVLRGDRDGDTKFSREFSEAKVPKCFRPDALKHQPTAVEYKGWVFGVAGILAAPFWLYASATGKCHMAPD